MICRVVVKRLNANTLERTYNTAGGKTFTSTLEFTADGVTNTMKCGDVVAKRVYKRD